MFALFAAVLLAVVFILHLVAGAGVDVVLFDLGLVFVALALAFGNWPVAVNWRRS
jgi:hypothetical protein